MKALDSTLGKMLKVRNTRVYNREASLGSGKPLCSQQQTKSTLISHTGLNHEVTLSYSCVREAELSTFDFFSSSVCFVLLAYADFTILEH